MTLGLGSLPPQRLKYASGLFNMMRNLGGAVGIAVCSAILNDRTNFHFTALASHLTATNTPMRRWLQAATSRLSLEHGASLSGHAAALKELWNLTYAQAETLAYSDAFRTIMAAFIIATCMVPLMKKVIPPKAPPADAH